MNRRQLVPDSEIISFGGLVKSLLMGDGCNPLAQIARLDSGDERPPNSLIDDCKTTNSYKVFKIKGFAFGYIEYLGPSTSEIVGNLTKENEWGESIQELYRGDLGSAQRESRMLIRAILDKDDIQVSKLCHNYVSSVLWKRDDGTAGAVSSFIKFNFKGENNIKTPVPTQAVDAGTSSDLRLYQLKDFGERETLWKMGIALGRARPGDTMLD